jgi:hypothetical protein
VRDPDDTADTADTTLCLLLGAPESANASTPDTTLCLLLGARESANASTPDNTLCRLLSAPESANGLFVKLDVLLALLLQALRDEALSSTSKFSKPVSERSEHGGCACDLFTEELAKLPLRDEASEYEGVSGGNMHKVIPRGSLDLQNLPVQTL